MFLAGTGAFLQRQRGKSTRDLSWFLITRGLWLIALEFTVVRLFVTFNLDYRFLGGAQVIWVIGVSMIVLAILILLPVRAIAVFGVGMIFLHNLLDGIRVQGWQPPNGAVPAVTAKIWILLHQPFEAFPVAGLSSPVVFVLYPIIPWAGVMAAGYAFGAVYRMGAQPRRRLLMTIGTAAVILFVILRVVNRYGDPSHWSRQDTWAFTFLSFLNTTKYPPSLLFLLMTLGPAMLLLCLFESKWITTATLDSTLAIVKNFFITFGRVPLFFYLLQWLTAHLMALGLHLVAGKSIRWMFSSELILTGAPPGMGFDLRVVYVSWILGIALLFPLCKWYAGVKARHRSWWLSYL